VNEGNAAAAECDKIFNNYIMARLHTWSQATKAQAPQQNSNTINNHKRSANDQQEDNHEQELHRDPRQLGTFSMAFATYAIVSNVLKSVVSRIWDSPAIQELQDHDRQLLKAQNDLTRGLNATDIAIIALHEVLINQAKLIQHNADQIAMMRFTNPRLMLAIGHVMARIVDYGAHLDQMKQDFNRHKPDLDRLSIITQTTVLEEAEPDSIPPK